MRKLKWTWLSFKLSGMTSFVNVLANYKCDKYDGEGYFKKVRWDNSTLGTHDDRSVMRELYLRKV